MGTARAPVVGSATWPAWTASVASCCWFASDIIVSFRFVWSLLLRTARMECDRTTIKRPASALDPGRQLQDRLRLAHLPFKSRTEGATGRTHTHAHSHDRNSAFP